ncbi:MAG: hypothetical protein JNK85_25350 [Verrucomicrobiales bacterium]|nr:hypothetical protein [Verrucomicrobiales bacterium]
MSSFPSTRWSLVLAAIEGSESTSREALSQLCQSYWYPIYAYLRRQGNSSHDAEDLTQEFFGRMLAEEWLNRADPLKGRLRTFLLTCLVRFVAKEKDKRTALKRGGGQSPISIDASSGEDQYRFEPADTLSPEVLFDRAWGLAVLERARANLAGEFAEAGKQQLYARLQHVLQGAKDPVGLEAIATELGKTESAIKMEALRMRRRYRDLVFAEVANTVSEPQETEKELRYLLRCVSGGN